ncbi:anti-sigma factor family protein [Cupriavidus plantarum]|uniref:anti-sigma factor family protein n=1 Tax=Cupriavidus plantarum TaxID=942865 RepID=UPI001B2377ED|nr:zf-HC2 domain-containing protein [Cupriavidus plantarum]CAG2135091.1 hypothetical protein LMG26296_02132 [Cupriavidus plantarum]SMR84516.1 Transmembrane transcriptional regulator (anti-sigma factor RsiW) [Cupriavidus plantarum]
MTIDETLLMAYADGELPPAQRAEVEALVARDPEAAALLALFEASKLDYAGAFATQDLPPVPESLTRGVEGLVLAHGARRAQQEAAGAEGSNVRSLDAERQKRRGVPVWLAAACMAGAFGAGLVIRGGLPGSGAGGAGSAPATVAGSASAPTVPGTAPITMASTTFAPWIKAAMEYQQLYTRDSVAYMPDVDARHLTRFIDDARDKDKLDIDVPDLSKAGLELKSVARLKFRGKALVQLVYLPKEGPPISLCVLAEPKDDQAVTANRVDAMHVVTWRQAKLGYVLLGNTEGLDLESIGKQIAAKDYPRLSI